MSTHSNSEAGYPNRNRHATTSPGVLMHGCTLPVDLTRLDPQWWGVDVTPESNKDHLTTYMGEQLKAYEPAELWDEELLYAFQEQFLGWTMDMFKNVHHTYLREMKRLLRTRGINTGPSNGNVAAQLSALLNVDSEVLPEYSNGYLAKTVFDNRCAAYKASLDLVGRTDTLNIRDAESTARRAEPPTQPSRQRTPFGVPFAKSNLKLEGTRQIHPGRPDLMPEENLYRGATPSAYPDFGERLNLATMPKTDESDPYKKLPPDHFENERLDASMITHFAKTFNRERKYNGDPYSLLDDALTILFDICWHAQIQPEQFHAVFPRILAGRAETYYMHYVDRRKDTFRVAYLKIKYHFETQVNHLKYHTDWTTITFNGVRTAPENGGKSLQEVLQIMLDKLALCQRALGDGYKGEQQLQTTVLRACRGVPELKFALFKPAQTCEALFSDLRSSIETHLDQGTHQMLMDEDEDQYYVDRRYNNYRGGYKGGHGQHGGGGGFRGSRGGYSSAGRYNYKERGVRKKICYVCKKEGCWSSNHSAEEQKKSRNSYIADCHFTGASTKEFATFLLDYEGHPAEVEELDDGADECFGNPGESDHWFTTVSYLTDQAFLYKLTGEDVYTACQPTIMSNSHQFLLEARYSKSSYQGILPDTGAANVSTVGKDQFEALQREETVAFDPTTAGRSSIKFGKGSLTTNLGTATVQTAIGAINFEVVEAPTPFLLCLKDMDNLRVYLDNTTNELVQLHEEGRTTRHPVIRKWGHPWFHLGKAGHAIFLTETELRRLHRRFGHPSIDRFFRLLEKAGVDVDHDLLSTITKFCHHCQLNGTAPTRFKFKLQDDKEFNYEIIVDVLNLMGKNTLHAVDSATAFHGARFLPSMSAKDTWETLRMLWIDTYQGPPDIIAHDAGTNFASTEFRAEAKLMGITCKQVPVEAHWSIGKVERYHQPLRRAFEILYAEVGRFTGDDAVLQMAVKAVNDTAGPHGLVPTLLVFGAYPRVTIESPPSPSTLKRGEAIQKAMKELRRIAAERQVGDALNTRNGPTTANILSLPLQSEVVVWREKEGWQGPYKVAAIQGHDVTVDMINGPVTFRSTLVKPYYRDENGPASGNGAPDDNSTSLTSPDEPERAPVQPRRRGRPRGSKNKPQADTFLSKKESDDWALAIKLRDDGVITTSGAPFETSDAKEVNDLVGRGVFKFELFNPEKHGGIRIFKSRMVREVKGKTTKPYEKSRLVVQGFKDREKEVILTQSPTLQRSSQRLILSIAPSLIAMGMSLDLRDITQAYPQAHTELARTILAELPPELKTKYPEGTILHVIKPLYGIAEAGVHWFTTYHGHHIGKLNMSTSTYDPCLLVTKGNHNDFGMVGMQTDDTLMLATPQFSALEIQKLEEAGFRSKPKTTLSRDAPLEFNGCTLTMTGSEITLTQKGQGAKIESIDTNAKDKQQQYVEQRARGAYIASICQPEAAFDLSTAAQAQHPDKQQCIELNKRLKWHISNLQRGLHYLPIDLSAAQLMIFVDGSFANNTDLSSQLGFIIMLTNQTLNDRSFTITGNTIHWSSTKCKRVTRSVLASEIYAMVHGFDIGLAIATTLRMITDRLGIPSVPVILCTDSYSLYECLVKLGSTLEKRLMIDIMALRQSYERREVSEIRWINGEDNPADAFTKATPNHTLKRWIDTNKITVRIQGCVQRPEGKVL